MKNDLELDASGFEVAPGTATFEVAPKFDCDGDLWVGLDRVHGTARTTTIGGFLSRKDVKRLRRHLKRALTNG